MNEQISMYDVMAEKEKTVNRIVAVMKRGKARTQEDKIIEFINRYGSITPMDAVNMGIMRLAARVYDINNSMNPKYRGIHIIAELDEAENQDGEMVKFARYRMG